jgi:AraC-like DNA-binding protein
MTISRRHGVKTPRHLAINELKPALYFAGCYHCRQEAWFQYRLPSPQLVLIESGCIEAKLKQGVVHAGARDLICFPPADSMRCDVHRPTLFYSAQVEFAGRPRQGLMPWLEGVGLLPVRVSLGESFEEMRKLFEVLCAEAPHAGVVHQLRIRAALFGILAVAAKVIGPHEEDEARIDPWVRAQQRLDLTLDGKLRIADLARQMGISTDHFIRRFKSRFGVSPKAYQMRARLQEAARSLKDGGQSIKTVAYNLGFSDPRSFGRCVKHFLGVRPSDLRFGLSAEGAQTGHSRRQVFPMNTHLVPPPVNWSSFIARYLPKGPRIPRTFAKSDVIVDKIRHPEHYL